jgi:hypothetical protein
LYKKKICQRRISSCLIFRRGSFLVGIQLFCFLNTCFYWWYLWLFFQMLFSFFVTWGQIFFIFQTFNAIGIFRSLVDDEWTDNIAFFKSFFQSVFFSYHVSTFLAFLSAGCSLYRREIERTCAVFFSSQNGRVLRG